MKKYIDGHFGVALVAAPFFWCLMLYFFDPALQLNWPLISPQIFLITVFIYPIVEELLFRGVLQGWLREQAWGMDSIAKISYANVVTSLIFSMFHLLSHTPILAAAVFFPSLVFGYFRDRYSHCHYMMLYPIALHMFYNAGWVWLFVPPV